MISRLAFLDDAAMRAAARAERAFLARVEGGCQVPVGVYATAEGTTLAIEAVRLIGSDRTSSQVHIERGNKKALKAL